MHLSIQQIKKILPHRYPFLLIDKITEINIEQGTAIAQKNVTINEEFFNGHFPSQPIMPGVLIVEAMAQAIGVLRVKMMDKEQDQNSKKLWVLAGIDNVRIKRPVIPGDILKFHVNMGKIKRGMFKSKAEAYVDGELIANAQFLAVYREM